MNNANYALLKSTNVAVTHRHTTTHTHDRCHTKVSESKKDNFHFIVRSHCSYLIFFFFSSFCHGLLSIFYSLCGGCEHVRYIFFSRSLKHTLLSSIFFRGTIYLFLWFWLRSKLKKEQQCVYFFCSLAVATAVCN